MENLNLFEKKFQIHRKVNIGDFVEYSGLNREMSPVTSYQICKVKQIIYGRYVDNEPLSLKANLIKGGKGKISNRPIIINGLQ